MGQAFPAITAALSNPAVQGALAAGSIIGTGFSVAAAREAQKDQEDAQKVAQAQAALANQRSIRRAIAQSRLARAQLIAAGQSQAGSTSSSAIQGGVSATQAQLGSEIGFARTTLASSQLQNSFLQSANRNISNAQTFGALANLPSQLGFAPGAFLANRQLPEAPGNLINPSTQGKFAGFGLG